MDTVLTTLAEDERSTNDNRPEQECNITATRFYLEEPSSPFSESRRDQYTGAVYNSASPIEVRVSTDFFTPDNAEWRGCVLPGWGEAWVRGDDVLSVSPIVDSIEGSHTRSFPSIMIKEMSDNSMAEVAELLTVIGHETHTLEVERHEGDELMDEWSRDVLMACPQLQEFRFDRGYFSSLEPFVDCAASYGTRLRCLSLSRLASDIPERVFCFFEALCDPNHGLTVHLQELSLGFDIFDANIQPLIDAVLKMLQMKPRVAWAHALPYSCRRARVPPTAS